MDQMLQAKDTDWLNGYKNKAHIYAVYKKPTLRHTQTESERMEKYIPCKQKAKESQISNPHIRQNRQNNLKKITTDKEGHYIMTKG